MKINEITKEMIQDYNICECDAISFTVEDMNYSCKKSYFKTQFPQIDLRKLKSKKTQNTYCCNHCVNKWGLDLCACGSGESIKQCDLETEECGKPAQILGEYNHVVAKDALGGW